MPKPIKYLDDLHRDLKLKYSNITNFYQTVDKKTKKIQKETNVYCPSKCNTCCTGKHRMVTQKEIELTCDYFLYYRYKEIPDLLHSVSNIYSRFLKQFNLTQEQFFNSEFDVNDNNHPYYRDFNYTCPYLSQEKGCLVYPVRFLKCRQYGYRLLTEELMDGCSKLFQGSEDVKRSWTDVDPDYEIPHSAPELEFFYNEVMPKYYDLGQNTIPKNFVFAGVYFIISLYVEKLAALKKAYIENPFSGN